MQSENRANIRGTRGASFLEAASGCRVALAGHARRCCGVHRALRAPSPGALSLLPLDPAPRRGRARRAAEHDGQGLRGTSARGARLRSAPLAVPDRPQRGDLAAAPAPRRAAARPRRSRVGTDSLPGTIETRERLARLREDLADLPDRQRAALVLRELNGLGHEEIAAVLDSSPRAIKQTIFEARASLGECDEGRDMPCAEIQRMLSDADGRVLRGRGASARTCAPAAAAASSRRRSRSARPTSHCWRRRSPQPRRRPAHGRRRRAERPRPAQERAGREGPAARRSASKIVALVTATAAAAGGTVAATEVVRRPPPRSHEAPTRPNARHGRRRAPLSARQLPGRSGPSVPVRARSVPAGRGRSIKTGTAEV